MNEKQVEAVRVVKEESKQLLYYGEEATATVMETYFGIIEADSDADIDFEVSRFRDFITRHNRKYLTWKESNTK